MSYLQRVFYNKYKTILNNNYSVYECTRKNSFIPDIEREESNSSKNKSNVISQTAIPPVHKINIIEENLLDVNKRHGFEIYMEEIREKFKNFYQQYLVGI